MRVKIVICLLALGVLAFARSSHIAWQENQKLEARLMSIAGPVIRKQPPIETDSRPQVPTSFTPGLGWGDYAPVDPSIRCNHSRKIIECGYGDGSPSWWECGDCNKRWDNSKDLPEWRKK